MASLAEALLTSYRIEPALELLVDASSRYADLGDHPAFVRLQGQLARAYFFNDEDARAVAVSDSVLEAAERLELVQIVADTLITRGSALTSMGRPYEGLGAIETGSRLAATRGFARTQMRGLINLCSLSVDGDPRAALAAIRAAMAIAERLGERGFQLFDNAFNAGAAIGDWDSLEALLEPLLTLETGSTLAVAVSDLLALRALRGEPTDDLRAQLQALPDVHGDTVRPAVLAWSDTILAFAAGEYAVARAHAHDYTAVFSQGVAEGYVLAARCALGLRDASAARDDLERSEPTTRRGRAIDAERTGIRAGIAAIEGRPAEAAALFRTALEELRDLGADWYEALCTIDVAALLDPSERSCDPPSTVRDGSSIACARHRSRRGSSVSRPPSTRPSRSVPPTDGAACPSPPMCLCRVAGRSIGDPPDEPASLEQVGRFRNDGHRRSRPPVDA